VQPGATFIFGGEAQDAMGDGLTLNGTGTSGEGAFRFSPRWKKENFTSATLSLPTDSTIDITDAASIFTFTGDISGPGILTKIGAGKLVLSTGTLAGATVRNGALAINGIDVISDDGDVRLTTGGLLDIADAQNETVGALYLDGELQAPGTYGRTGSGAAHENDTFFTGRLGILTAGSPAPIITAFSLADQSTTSTLFTNAATVDVTLTATAVDGDIVGYKVTETDVEPTEWPAEAPATFVLGAEGSVTLYGWVKDSNGMVTKATTTILFSTATPVVTNVAIVNNGDGTATATWTTDIAAEGSVKFGIVTMLGGTPNEAKENATGTSHSVVLTGIAAGANYKIVLVNNEIASAPIYWPKPWPIDGDANMDCRVNILDLIFIRNKLNQPVGTGDNWKADVNEDAKINILDLIFVRNKLNTSCP